MCFPINGLRNIVFNIISGLPLCFPLNVVYSDRQQLEECLEMESALLLSLKHRSSIFSTVQGRKSSCPGCLILCGEHSPELSCFRELWPGNFPFRTLDKGIWSTHPQTQLEHETLLMNKLAEPGNLEAFPEFCPARVCLYTWEAERKGGRERGRGTW